MIKYIFALLIFVSCKTTSLNGIKKIDGTVETCTMDSTAFFNPPVIKLLLKKANKNADCSNKPSFNINYDDWPMHISLWFDKKVFYLCTNKDFVTNSKGQVEQVRYKLIYGKLKYNAKTQILILKSKELNWKQSYKLNYNVVDSVITLSKII
jgi:hypothetical protein